MLILIYSAQTFITQHETSITYCKKLCDCHNNVGVRNWHFPGEYSNETRIGNIFAYKENTTCFRKRSVGVWGFRTKNTDTFLRIRIF